MSCAIDRRRRRLLVACVSAALTGLPARGSGLDASDWSSLKKAIRGRFPEVRQVGTEELHAAFASGDPPLLLDARTAAEYRVSHLKGAQRAETAAQAKQALGQVPKDRLIVVYCSVGYRSSALARELMRSGYTQVANLEGSIFEWANKGFEVYRAAEFVTVVHPYDATWGKLLDRRLWSTTP